MLRKFSGFVCSITVYIAAFLLVASAVRAEDPAELGEISTTKIAQQLANPNSPLAIIAMKNQYTFYKGSLPGADRQGNYDFVLQPAFPFMLDNGHRIFFRPTLTVFADKPVFNRAKGTFEGKSGLGDLGIDLTYGETLKSGFLWSLGGSASLPTATENGLGYQQWLLGPRLGLGLIKDWGVLAVFPMHQWNIAGWAAADTSLTTIQPIATMLLGGGWAVGSSPTISYDWHQSQWTVPVDLMVSRTVLFGKMPVRLGLSVDYFVDKPGKFGPDVMIGFNVTPVVKNSFAR
jgi:hypothetical protein